MRKEMNKGCGEGWHMGGGQWRRGEKERAEERGRRGQGRTGHQQPLILPSTETQVLPTWLPPFYPISSMHFCYSEAFPTEDIFQAR